MKKTRTFRPLAIVVAVAAIASSLVFLTGGHALLGSVFGVVCAVVFWLPTGLICPVCQTTLEGEGDRALALGFQNERCPRCHVGG